MRRTLYLDSLLIACILVVLWIALCLCRTACGTTCWVRASCHDGSVSQGRGVLVSDGQKDSYPFVLSATHILHGAKGQATVIFPDGRRIRTVRSVQSPNYDVIGLCLPPGQSLPPVTQHSGEWPQYAATFRGRAATHARYYNDRGRRIFSVYVTSYNGDSGGPIKDDSGRVVSIISTADSRDTQGVPPAYLKQFVSRFQQYYVNPMCQPGQSCYPDQYGPPQVPGIPPTTAKPATRPPTESGTDKLLKQLLDAMAKDKRFIPKRGPEGKPGPMGIQGPPGDAADTTEIWDGLRTAQEAMESLVSETQLLRSDLSTDNATLRAELQQLRQRVIDLENRIQGMQFRTNIDGKPGTVSVDGGLLEISFDDS